MLERARPSLVSGGDYNAIRSYSSCGRILQSKSPPTSESPGLSQSLIGTAIGNSHFDYQGQTIVYFRPRTTLADVTAALSI